MGNYFKEFDTTPANLITDLKAQMLNSTNWSNASGGSGHVMTATTTHGAQMVIDLADASATSRQLTVGIYRTWASGAGTDKITRYLCWHTQVAGATSDPIHVLLSLGQDHLYVTIEGPRPGEANAEDTANGSARQVLLLSDMIPYFAAEPSGLVCALANSITLVAQSTATVNISRNRANTQSWVIAKLATLTMPAGNLQTSSTPAWFGLQRNCQADSNVYLWPYIVVEDIAGLRGRLSKIFFAGMVGGNLAPASGTTDFPPPLYQRLTYNSENYMLVGTNKAGANQHNRTALGWTDQGSATGFATQPVVAVPIA